MGFLPLILLFVFFWVFIILPNSKREKQRQAMLDALKAGDRVETVGRIFGTVAYIRKDKVVILIGVNSHGDNVNPEICVHRDGIARVLSSSEATEKFFE